MMMKPEVPSMLSDKNEVEESNKRQSVSEESEDDYDDTRSVSLQSDEEENRVISSVTTMMTKPGQVTPVRQKRGSRWQSFKWEDIPYANRITKTRPSSLYHEITISRVARPQQTVMTRNRAKVMSPRGSSQSGCNRTLADSREKT